MDEYLKQLEKEKEIVYNILAVIIGILFIIGSIICIQWVVGFAFGVTLTFWQSLALWVMAQVLLFPKGSSK